MLLLLCYVVFFLEILAGFPERETEIRSRKEDRWIICFHKSQVL